VLESFLAWVWIHLLLVIEGVLVMLHTEAAFRNLDLGSTWLSSVPPAYSHLVVERQTGGDSARARDMGVEQNLGLLEYFRERQIWELDADAEPLKLVRLN
jgi:hypothetical protein